jgi:hypothetical protein
MAPQTSVYSTRFRIVAAAIVAVAAVVFFIAYRSAQEGEDDPIASSGESGEVVEVLIPARGAQVPQQSDVGIDLQEGWTGTLVLNGTSIPEDELQITLELGLVQFTPGDGKAVEELRAGQNDVQAIIWPRSEGAGGDETRTIAWSFDAV